MGVREFKAILGDAPYFPIAHVRIEKEKGKFLYCVSLYILRDEKTIEVCTIDNSHEKGHHIHYLENGEKIKQEPFDYECIYKTVEYLKENWESIVRGEWKK